MRQQASKASITRRTFIKGMGLLSVSTALSACAQQERNGGSEAATPLLAIIHTNDTHGYDVETRAESDGKGNFSMAAVAALKAEWEEKGYDVILVDAGDATQGTPLVDTSKGMPAIAFMNACGYDLMTVGNHDFDWGQDALADNENAAEFPFLSANVLNGSDGKPRFTPNKAIELTDGTKIGFFGLTTPETKTVCNPKNLTGLTFLKDQELYACAQEQVDELRRRGCDLVVCVGHLGKSDRTRSNSKAVLQNVKGIDIFIDGHDHEEVNEDVEGTLLVETGCYLHNIGVVAIDKGRPAEGMVAYGSFAKTDPSVQAVIDSENSRVEAELSVVLGQTPFMLDGNREPGVRTQETNLGDFCCDAFRWKAEQALGRTVDASLINGGSIRASIGAGNISLKSIKTVMPFSNDIAVIKITGAQLLEAIEAACQNVGTDNAIGAFPQVSNITYTIDSSIPYEAGPNYPDSTFASPAAPGKRASISDVGGRGFSADETYSLATITFLCDGGDTYYAFKQAADAEAPVTCGFDYEAFASYLTQGCHSMVPNEYENPQGRITIT